MQEILGLPLDAYTSFFDIKKVHNRVRLEMLWEWLCWQHCVNCHLLLVVKLMYICLLQSFSSVRVVKSQSCTTDIRPWQGFSLSLHLLIIYMNWINSHAGWSGCRFWNCRLNR